MFDNIGAKIKTVAKVVCWIGIIASIIIGFIMLVQDEDTAFAGLLTMVLGSLGSWMLKETLLYLWNIKWNRI